MSTYFFTDNTYYLTDCFVKISETSRNCRKPEKVFSYK